MKSPRTTNRIINSVRGWFHFGFCPMTATVANWGGFACPRWVVIISHGGHGDETLYHDEFDTHAIASRSARAVNSTISREWNRLNKVAA